MDTPRLDSGLRRNDAYVENRDPVIDEREEAVTSLPSLRPTTYSLFPIQLPSTSPSEQQFCYRERTIVFYVQCWAFALASGVSC